MELRYGFGFISSSENDACQSEGVIEKVETWDGFLSPKFISEYNDNSKGVFVYINGEKYIFMGIGDLTVGEEVVINYLPKNNVVLEVQRK